MYKIKDQTLLNIVVGPSIAYISKNFDIVAAKAIYYDDFDNIIIGVLDRTNHGLSAFSVITNSTYFNLNIYECPGGCPNTIIFDPTNLSYFPKEAIYENFFSLQTVK